MFVPKIFVGVSIFVDRNLLFLLVYNSSFFIFFYLSKGPYRMRKKFVTEKISLILIFIFFISRDISKHILSIKICQFSSFIKYSFHFFALRNFFKFIFVQFIGENVKFERIFYYIENLTFLSFSNFKFFRISNFLKFCFFMF